MKILLVLLLFNLLSFLLMGVDKKKAKRHQWRLSEKSLFIFALLGGSLGILLGMHFFHHKTKKRKFRYGVPILLLLQLFVVFAISYWI